MARLKLNPAPTFAAPVAVPVAGGAAVAIVMTFRHRTKDQLDAFIKGRADKTDVESFTDMVVGWEGVIGDDDAPMPFTRENVERFLGNYIGAALATFQTYLDELVKARRGN